MEKKIKIGFDLDGVILYNPARLIRPLMSLLKHCGVIKRKQLQFYQPKTHLAQEFWKFCHKSSIFVSPGYNELKNLVAQNKVEAYLITARFDFLKDDLDHWLKKIEADKVFTQVYYNEHNDQPHLHKARILKKLNLDIYVEDNWDIVDYLNQHFKVLTHKPSLETKIFWVYNFLDNKINYQYKFSGLWQVVATIKSLVIKEQA